MRRLLKYMRGYGKECVMGPLFKLLEASFELLIPLVVAQIVDVGIAGGDGSYIAKMCIMMIALGIVGLVCAVTAQYFAAKAAVGFSTRLRHSVMAHILSLSHSQLDALGTSAMVTRLTSDINQVQNGVNLTLRLLLRSPFVVFGAMIMAFSIDAQVSLVFVGLIGMLCVIVFGILLVTMPMHTKVQEDLDRVTAATRQNLTGVRVLRAFRVEERETESFARKTQELSQRQLRTGRISGLMNPATFVVVNLAVIVLVHVGAVKVDGGVLTQGLVIALYNYMSQILVELVKMANLIITVAKAVACGNRIEGVLEIYPEESRGTVREPIRGRVELRDVTFSYDGSGAASLEHISFHVEAGQTVGILGGTGSGKTTLVNLISGYYPVTEGRILIDGVDVADYDPVFLRGNVGIVPQKAVLFRGTIRDNLLWGNENATEDALWHALDIAQAREVVKDRVGELDAKVSQGGSNFSGGQRQRLTIARALVRKSGILILDDSASALDYATDARLRMALQDRKDKPTTFIVSQRASSVRFADLIVVLDDGRMAGCGTHQQLLDACPVYREIFYSQYEKEEQGNG